MLPAWHVPLSELQYKQREPAKIKVSAYHPDAIEQYEKGIPISSNHPSIHEMLAEWLPESHPNVDEQLQNPVDNPIPVRMPMII